MAKQGYVVGFLFDDIGRVVLIQKNRPAWQAGKINGVGGKVEPEEFPFDAMIREFQEETGVEFVDWDKFAKLESPRSEIWVYRGFTTADVVDSVRTMEDEAVVVFEHRYLRVLNTVPNLQWLIPLALQTDNVKVLANYE